MTRARTVAVVGAGSWGTALAMVLARNGHSTRLWGRDADQLSRLENEKCNSTYLPGYQFPEGLSICADLSVALASAEWVLVCVPSHGFANCLESLAPLLKPEVGLVWATKGLEPDTGRLLDEIVVERRGQGSKRAVLSGPSFALEVAAGLPTAVTLAANSPEVAQELAQVFHDASFRVYTSEDMVGVQVGGAVKNVLAIAAGIADGLTFGANTRAALITRGLAELSRLGAAMGGQSRTFMGLAGLGDLLLTCTDNQSRNRRFGLALAQGEPAMEAMARLGQVVEGYRNSREVMILAQRYDIDMPIADQVHKVLYEGLAPRAAVQALLSRALTREDG